MPKKHVNFFDLAHFTTKQREALAASKKFRFLFYGGSMGSGKAAKVSEKIITPFGFRSLGDLKVGDTILHVSGRPQKVIAVIPQGLCRIFRITFDDGSVFDCNEQHLWQVRETQHMTKRAHPWRVWTTKQMKDFVDRGGGKHGKKGKLVIPLCDELVFTKSYKTPQLLLHPYLLGVLLGDGSVSSSTISFSSADKEIPEKLSDLGYSISKHAKSISFGVLGISDELKRLGVHGKRAWEKSVPKPYLFSSVGERKQLLQGLMDTDGFVDKTGRLSFTSTSLQLAKNVQFLVRSLGGRASITSKIPTFSYHGKKKQGRRAYTVSILMKDNREIVWLPRKRDRVVQSQASRDQLTRGIASIVRTDEYAEMRCISVDEPDGLFIAGEDLIVTHNSYFLRWALLFHLLRFYAKTKQKGIRVALFCEDYPSLSDRHISRIRNEFPTELGSYHEQMHEFRLAPTLGGGVLAFRNLDDPSKYQSSEFAAIAVDELPKNSYQTFAMLRTRLRWPGIRKPRFLSAGNPGGEAWVRQYFVERRFPPSEQEPNEFIFIKALPKDNPNLPPEYFASLESLPEDQRKAYLEGNWFAFDQSIDEKGYARLLTDTELQNAIVSAGVHVGEKVLGIDPAAGGDSSSLVLASETFAEVIFNQKMEDTMQLVPLAVDACKKHKCRTIAVDTTGVGQGLFDRLREVAKGEGLSVRPVVFGGKAKKEERFANLKAEIFWEVREWIMGGGKLKKDDAWNELSVVKWRADSERVIEIQSKSDLRRANIPSPNVADALAIAKAFRPSAVSAKVRKQNPGRKTRSFSIAY